MRSEQGSVSEGVAAVAAAAHRYRALDALRGICALCVCLFHFKALGPVAESAFVRGSWLFVDFFFVLSGFVIACSWGGRLARPGQIRRFALLRLGRVWPLHMVMLLLFLAMECAGLALQAFDVSIRQVFDASHSPLAWLLSAGLLQIFGLLPSLTWNHPSWSIAAEFWTYLLFAGLLVLSGRRSTPVLAAAAVISLACLVALSDNGIDATHVHSLWRCLYGFCTGALLWRLVERHRAPALGTAGELAAVAGVVAFVALASQPPANLLAPLVFAAAIHVFTAESGRVSRLLLADWPQRLGAWSYSIYMVHVFVQSRFDDVLRVAARLGAPVMTSKGTLNGAAFDYVGTTPAMGLVLTGVMLVVVIGLSSLTYRWIELPGQRWARDRAQRLAD